MNRHLGYKTLPTFKTTKQGEIWLSLENKKSTTQ